MIPHKKRCIDNDFHHSTEIVIAYSIFHIIEIIACCILTCVITPFWKYHCDMNNSYPIQFIISMLNNLIIKCLKPKQILNDKIIHKFIYKDD